MSGERKGIRMKRTEISQPQNRPDLLIVVADQWRGDVMGHLGNPAAITPNLDALVQSEAVSFSQAYCQNPVCTPSRCSFMSGWYPHVHGHRTMYHMLQPGEPMLLKDLKDAGYFVWWGGKNDVVPGQYGYSTYCDVHFWSTTQIKRPMRADLHSSSDWRGDPGSDTFYSFFYGKIEKPTDFPVDEPFVYDAEWHTVFGAIDQIQHAPQGQPLCVYLALGYPHPPYAVEEPWFSQVRREQLPSRIPAPLDWHGKPSILRGIAERQNLQNWSEERWTELRATYYGMCARVDYQVGLIVNALKASGRYDRTALFFFADHGDFTGDYGLVEKTQNTFEDCLTRVPLIIKPPAGMERQPGICNALVELVDFRATVEEWVGLVPGYDHFGRSLLPLIRGEVIEHRPAVFCEGGRLRDERQAMELESDQSPEGLYWPRLNVQSGDGPEHTKATMCRTHDFKYVHRLYEQDELYDLVNDPHELHNRIDEPGLDQVRGQLKDLLLDFYLSTADVVPMKVDQRW